MEKRSYAVRQLIEKNRRADMRRILGVKRIRRIKLGDFLLLMLPLLVLLIFIPPGDTAEVNQEPFEEPKNVTREVRIKVYNPEVSLVDEYDLEDYILGVVAAEMPSEFSQEALKAQAVAARTFAFSRMKGLYGSAGNHFGADVCTESSHCQAWVSKEQFLKSYGNEAGWAKIEKAVAETKSKIMTYDGILINPLYHSNSGGATEDIREVWTVLGEVPYLKSVYSPDENQYAEFQKESTFLWADIVKKVKQQYPEAKVGSNPKKEMEILAYSSSGRVASLRLGSVTLSGVEFRELFSLRSTNMEISFPDKKSVHIKTKGYGHGVGMSQCGADALGRKGMDYTKILEYYYTGIKVEDLAQ